VESSHRPARCSPLRCDGQLDEPPGRRGGSLACFLVGRCKHVSDNAERSLASTSRFGLDAFSNVGEGRERMAAYGRGAGYLAGVHVDEFDNRTSAMRPWACGLTVTRPARIGGAKRKGGACRQPAEPVGFRNNLCKSFLFPSFWYDSRVLNNTD
jgi:hypothetical protein